MGKKHWIIICSWLFVLSAGAQTMQEKEQYMKEAGNFALLYQGKLEEGYRRGYVNTPYQPQEFELGNLVYEGIDYSQVPMRLDYYTGRVIIKSPNGQYHIVLLPEVAQRVTIGDRDYVYFSAKDKAPASTYYVALFEGKEWGIYKQYYVGNINQDLEQGKIRKEFSSKQRVYFKKGNRWQVLGGKEDLFKLFKGDKDRLKAYCKQENLRPNDRREEDWIRLATYCATLTE